MCVFGACLADLCTNQEVFVKHIELSANIGYFKQAKNADFTNVQFGVEK